LQQKYELPHGYFWAILNSIVIFTIFPFNFNG